MQNENIHGFKKRVTNLIGERAFRKSALNIRDGAGVFEKVLGGQKHYSRVLEIGTYKGITSAYMTKFCDHVDTIDLVVGKQELNGESFSRDDFWNSMGVAEKITLHLVSGDPAKALLIKSLKFDFAFIDGGKYDVAQDFESTKHCGTVLFHDYDDRGKPSKNIVYDFVKSLPKHEVKVMDIFALWQAGGF